MVDGAPNNIKEAVSKAEADELKGKLETAGASVRAQVVPPAAAPRGVAVGHGLGRRSGLASARPSRRPGAAAGGRAFAAS